MSKWRMTEMGTSPQALTIRESRVVLSSLNPLRNRAGKVVVLCSL